MIQDEPGFQDLTETNNAQRVRARMEHSRRTRHVFVQVPPRNGKSAHMRSSRREEDATRVRAALAPGGNTAPRSLPSGPAPLNPTGFAIALFLLGLIALAMGLGAIAWIVFSLLRGLGNLSSKDGI